MKKTLNEILLRRKNKVVVNVKPNQDLKDSVKDSKIDQYLATIMKNFEDLGYTFSKDLYEALQTLTTDEIGNFYLEIEPILRNLVGADKKYEPMYPNFPKSVMEEEDTVLYFNAIVHYWSFGTLYPVSEKKIRLPLFDTTKVKVIDLGTKDEIVEIFNNLCQSKTSLSETDRDDLEWIFGNFEPTPDFPDEIPFKENIAIVGKLYIESDPLASASAIQKYFKTATDVLRLITALSDGDISLATNTRYRNFRRKERRLLLELLQNCGSIEEDMLRYKAKWIHVGEKLHPCEYNEAQYGKVITAFNKIRNNVHIDTFNSKVEKAINDKDFDNAVKILSNRPGEFARRLDHLMRSAKDENEVLNIINTFKNVSSKISSTVLLQVKEHFTYNSKDFKARVFFPKGSLARNYCIENNLKSIPEKYRRAVMSICENALIEIYKQKDFMGNVYLSEDLKNYIIPFSQRSASKTTKTITRGSRIPFDKDAKAMRAFVWWTNAEYYNHHDDRVDLDLTAAFFDEDWKYKDHVSYTNIRSNKFRACHSGDIVNGGPINGNGVTEFLDFDIDSVTEYGVRYIVYQVYSFTGQRFASLPHAMFGWMSREDVNSGEIYEPRTVEQIMDLSSDSVVCIPVIFDCVKREFIWCDMNLTIDGSHTRYLGNNVESNLRGVAATCYGIVNLPKPNLYDLIELHIKARGVKVDNKDEADIIFDISRDIEPVDLQEQSSETSAEETENTETEATEKPKDEETQEEVVSDEVEETEETEKPAPRIITPYDLDVFMAEFL